MPHSSLRRALVLGAAALTPAARPAAALQELPPPVPPPCSAEPVLFGAPGAPARAAARAYAQAHDDAHAAVVARARGVGYLGVRLSELSERRWTPEGLLVRYCAYPVVVSVEPASPAERAGLDAGDTLVAYGARDLVRDGAVALDRLLVPGEALRVRVRRGGRTLTRVVTVGRRPGAQAWAFDTRSLVGAAARAARPGAGAVTIGPFPRAGGGSSDGPVVVGPGTVAPFRVDVAWPAGESDDRDDRGARTPARLRAEQRLFQREAVELQGLTRQTRIQVLTPDGLTAAWSPGGSTALAGAQLVALDDDLREVLVAGGGSPAGGPTRGVFVLKVLPGTPAAEAGLRAGDVVTAAGGRPVETPAALQRVLAGRALAGRTAERREVGLRVARAGVAREATLRW